MVRPLILAIAAAVLLPCGGALAASAGQADVRVEYGPDAPSAIVSRLQHRLEGDPSAFYGALPPAVKGQPLSMILQSTPRGVNVKIEIPGASDQAVQAAKAIAVPLTEVAQEVGGDYAEQTTVESSGSGWPRLPSLSSLPHFSLPQLPQVSLDAWVASLGRWAIGLAALLALVVLALGAVALRRNRGASGTKMPMATLAGSPVLGLLPQSLVRVGKVYHLQSKPCQALAHFFEQRAGNTREIAIHGVSAESAAIVAVVLGLFGVRRGERVLLVDLSESESVIPAILARFGPPPEQGAGAQGTSIPDLDYMILAAGPKDRMSTIPDSVLQQYVRILIVSPSGVRPSGMPVVEVALKLSPLDRLRAQFVRNRLGWVFLGEGVPLRVSDRYYTRYYYERLHAVSDAPIASSDNA